MSDKKNKPDLKIVSSNKKPDENKLTKKQLGFIDSILNGKSLVESYLEHYQVSPKTKNSTIRHMASQLRANPNITQTINKRIEEKKRNNLATEHKIKDHLLNSLLGFINDDTESTANKLKAIEMYGRNLDLWKQNIVIEEKNNSSTEVETRLREKLGKLLEK